MPTFVIANKNSSNIQNLEKMRAKFNRLECLSLDQVSETMSELKGCKVVVDLDRWDNNYNLSIYGDMPDSMDYLDDMDDTDWEGEETYETLKASWEKTYSA